MTMKRMGGEDPGMDPDVVVDARCMDYWLRRKLIAAGRIHVQVIVTDKSLKYSGGYLPTSILFVESEEDVKEEFERLRRVLPGAILIQEEGYNQALSDLDKLAAPLKRERRQNRGSGVMSADSRGSKFPSFPVRVVASEGTKLNPGTNEFGDGMSIVVEVPADAGMKAKRAELAASRDTAAKPNLPENIRQLAQQAVEELEKEIGDQAVDLDQVFDIRVEVRADRRREFVLTPTAEPSQGTFYLARHPQSFKGGKSTCYPQDSGFAWTSDDRTAFFAKKNGGAHIKLYNLGIKGWEKQDLTITINEGLFIVTGAGGPHAYGCGPSPDNLEYLLAEIAERVGEARGCSAASSGGRLLGDLPKLVKEANGGNGRTTPLPTPSHVATPEDDAVADPTGEPAPAPAAPAAKPATRRKPKAPAGTAEPT